MAFNWDYLTLLLSVIAIGITLYLLLTKGSSVGDRGKTGTTGPTGTVGFTGPVGTRGFNGSAAQTGPTGPTGADPTDTTDIRLTEPADVPYTDPLVSFSNAPYFTPLPRHYGYIFPGSGIVDVPSGPEVIITSAVFNSGSTGYGDSITIVDNSSFYIQKTGVYCVSAGGYITGTGYSAPNTMFRQLFYLQVKNGIDLIHRMPQANVSQNSTTLVSSSGIINAVPGDVVELVVAHSSPGFTAKFGAPETPFTIVRIV